MTRQEFQGGWYGDARGRAFAVLIRDREIQTSRGVVPLPRGSNVLNLRLAPDGIHFAGIGHEDPIRDRPMEWDGDQWITHEGFAFGPRSVIYDASGTLHIHRGPTATGYRFLDPVDGHLVTATETREDLARRLWEYTELGDGLTIGQGGQGRDGEDPLIVLLDGTRRLLARGTCRGINASRDGDVVTLCWVQEDRGLTVVAAYTLDELRALPVALDAASPTDPSPPPIPDPEPEPEPEPEPVPPIPVPPTKEAMEKTKDQVRADIDELIRFYQEPDGLNRAARGIKPPVVFHDPAITDWFTLAVLQPIEDIKRQIRTFPEWKEQHTSDPAPEPP